MSELAAENKFELNSDEIVYLIRGLNCAVVYAILNAESVKDLQSKLNIKLREQLVKEHSAINELQEFYNMEYGGDYE